MPNNVLILGLMFLGVHCIGAGWYARECLMIAENVHSREQFEDRQFYIAVFVIWTLMLLGWELFAFFAACGFKVWEVSNDT